MKSTVFYLYPLSTGIHNGKTFEGTNREDAEAKALDAGYDIYSDYGMTTDPPSRQRLMQKAIYGTFNN